MAKTYRVDGMTCGGCANSVKRALEAAAPGTRIEVDLPQGRVTLADPPGDAVVEQAIRDAGFTYGGPV